MLVMAWRTSKSLVSFARPLAKEWVNILNQFYWFILTTILLRTRFLSLDLRLRMLRRVMNSLARFDHHPKSFDRIDRLYLLIFFQHMSCKPLLCMNMPYRIPLALLHQECIHHPDIQMFAILLGYALWSWKQTSLTTTHIIIVVQEGSIDVYVALRAIILYHPGLCWR